MFKRNFILLLLTMTVVVVLINSTNNNELEIVSVSNINDGILLEDLKQISNRVCVRRPWKICSDVAELGEIRASSAQGWRRSHTVPGHR